MRSKSHIFSIGHGNKSIEKFIQELKSFDVKYLIDIRSKPYSKFNPHFNKEMLKCYIERENIVYIFMGDSLGGLPAETSCYTSGKVDYDKLKIKDFFVTSLLKLKIANDKGLNSTIMCSEGSPTECHRTKLIGVELQKMGIELRHITDIGKEKTQNQVILELTNGNGLINLFGEESFTSRKQYL